MFIIFVEGEKRAGISQHEPGGKDQGTRSKDHCTGGEVAKGFKKQ